MQKDEEQTLPATATAAPLEDRKSSWAPRLHCLLPQRLLDQSNVKLILLLGLHRRGWHRLRDDRQGWHRLRDSRQPLLHRVRRDGNRPVQQIHCNHVCRPVIFVPVPWWWIFFYLKKKKKTTFETLRHCDSSLGLIAFETLRTDY